MTLIFSLRLVSAILFHVLPVVQVQVLVLVIQQSGSPISIGFSRFEVPTPLSIFSAVLRRKSAEKFQMFSNHV
jgi:hypothetical protein